MKKAVFLLLVVFASVYSWGQDITGEWNGVLKVQGMQLKLVFHISQTETGYGATMDSPDQGVKGLPVTSVTFDNPVLKLSVAGARIEYEGKMGDDGVITGTFKQHGASFPLDLSRGKAEKEALVRPQEPVKPYPYYEEEVSFENSEDNVTLAGTLTLPEKEGNFPAIVLISGSGAQNRDEEIMGHKPFLVLSDFLTRNGVAVLRFDDRGIAASTGNAMTSTTFDFSKDVEAGVKYLQTRKEINRKQIGLAGHSEGGIIASMLAARNSDIAFIILLAGTGIPGDQLLLMQQELIAKASGISDSEWQKVKPVNRAAFDIIIRSTNQEQLNTDMTEYLKQTIKDNPNMKPEGISEDDFIRQSIVLMANPWMKYFLGYDPVPALEKVKCPVLAINGGKDLQVPAKVNLEAIKAALTRGGNKQVTTKEIPGLNHLFQECETGLPVEYPTIEQTFSP
ncbi:MAG: alpha/beta hydrolase, partial [Tannerella sp.]|nr:alpha/beta hydrolase [Tannerella sp.]